MLKKAGKGLKWTHIWAAENKDIVDEEVARQERHHAGTWNSAVSRLAHQLPPEEIEKYKEMANNARQDVPSEAQQKS